LVNKLNEGVGKKIVEALKKQSEGELEPIETETLAFDGLISNLDNEVKEEVETTDLFAESFEQNVELDNVESDSVEEVENIQQIDIDAFAEDVQLETPVKNIESKDFSSIDLNSFLEKEPVKPQPIYHELPDVELPSNILILKKLIAQLPSGVTRHTGAQIIKQTMEALGISMKSVLKEAQEVQEGLKDSARDCHATIQEYKKQIALLEKQSQNYQKQYGALNDLISLFIQTTK